MKYNIGDCVEIKDYLGRKFHDYIGSIYTENIVCGKNTVSPWLESSTRYLLDSSLRWVKDDDIIMVLGNETL